MSNNSFGELFCLTTAGESHGEAMVAILDGCPARVPLSAQVIQTELNKRRPGQNKFTSPRQETDQIKILSGVFEGLTTGTPIAMLIHNQDAKSQDYDHLKESFRPGHADYGYHMKYGHRDHRGGGRASARETAMWVAAGAIANQVCSQLGIEIFGFCNQIGSLVIPFDSESQIEKNSFWIANQSYVSKVESLLDDTLQQQDSLAAQMTVIARGVPAGLGEPVFQKLDAQIARAMMGINAVKAVEIGEGVGVLMQQGSQHRDAMHADGFASNHAGGICGGISTGEEIRVKITVKPTSSIGQPISSINVNREATQIEVTGRHDPCIGLRAVPIAVALMRLVILDNFLQQQARQLPATQTRGEYERA